MTPFDQKIKEKVEEFGENFKEVAQEKEDFKGEGLFVLMILFNSALKDVLADQRKELREEIEGKIELAKEQGFSLSWIDALSDLLSSEILKEDD